MSKDIIVIEQLPIISQNLMAIKAEVDARTARAASLICTEDTVKEVKKERAELNKEFTTLENERKRVKSAILKPYEEFEAVYKECVSAAYKAADEALKGKIADVENGLKAERQAAFNEYFDRKKSETGIDFVVPEQVGVKITLSGSAESYKQAADAFFDSVLADIRTIDMMIIDKMTDKDEILYEYKQTLDLGEAIAAVTNRKAALKAQEEHKAAQAEQPDAPDALDGLPDFPGDLDELPDFPGDLAELPPVPEEPTIFEEPERDYHIHVVCGKTVFAEIATYLNSIGVSWEVKENEI